MMTIDKTFIYLNQQLHWDEIAENNELADFVLTVADSQHKSWQKLHGKVVDALCLTNFLDNVALL